MADGDGAYVTTYWTVVESPIGGLLLQANGDDLTGLDWHPDFGDLPHDARDGKRLDVIRQTASELREYFAGKRRAFTVSIDPAGTHFQRVVWQQMRSIAYGETMAYGDVAGAVGRPAAARAVGTAVGQNRVSIIVPDHRVVSSTGALSGSKTGMLYRKRLYDLERDFLEKRTRRS